MIDIRLKEMPYEYNGRTYMLRCNFNVLADLQEEYGEIPDVLNGKKTMKSVTAFLAAMINDYADEKGWPERVTAKQIGRSLPAAPDMELMKKIVGIVLNALYVQNDDNDDPEAQEQGDGEKN